MLTELLTQCEVGGHRRHEVREEGIVRSPFSLRSSRLDGDSALQAPRPVHGSPRAAQGHSALRTSRHGQDDAGEGASGERGLDVGGGDRVLSVLLQYIVLLPHEQVGGREREDRKGAVPVRGSVRCVTDSVAYKNQPSIVFIDEIDSILTARRWVQVA